MKKFFFILFLNYSCIFNSQTYDNEYYKKFEGNYMGEGGSELKIIFKETFFVISDDEGASFKGYPSNGKIKYNNGSNSFEYITWDKDVENCIRQGDFEWLFCNTEKETKEKEKVLSIKDLSIINKYVGKWQGTSYEDKDILYKINISLSDEGIVFYNINDNKKCFLSLKNSDKMTGEIFFSKWGEIIPFRLEIYEGKLILEDYYQYSITFEKIE